ncbi:chorismate mutase [Methanocaldococcus villosus KIN24-T80]|uniref:Chorismate mutase n=1 Tax=Methanocaldococcus villosus KIN24-T80 TaxID=1069083 RepID=N6UVP5_9EURY|nr:chorismate mutase [Methanocaldococcus villosus]ENN96414.1 chorismate mutase [Methanocaldococcus villosus KIN24-T80]
MKDLKKLREKIDEIDENILKLIAERNRLAKDIAEAKKALGLEIDDPKREKHIYEKIKRLCNCYNIDEDMAIKIFKILIEHNKKLQKKHLKGENYG